LVLLWVHENSVVWDPLELEALPLHSGGHQQLKFKFNPAHVAPPFLYLSGHLAAEALQPKSRRTSSASLSAADVREREKCGGGRR